MSEQTKPTQAQQPTFIALTCRIVGDITLEGDATILGGVEGSVDVTGNLRIGPQGGVHGRVQAGALALEGQIDGDVRCEGNVELDGRVEGDVICGETIAIGAGANVVGTVYAKAIAVSEGATYRGHVVIGASPAAEAERAGLERSQRGASPRLDGEAVTVESTLDADTNRAAVAGLLRRRPSVLNRTTAASA